MDAWSEVYQPAVSRRAALAYSGDVELPQLDAGAVQEALHQDIVHHLQIPCSTHSQAQTRSRDQGMLGLQSTVSRDRSCSTAVYAFFRRRVMCTLRFFVTAHCAPYLAAARDPPAPSRSEPSWGTGGYTRRAKMRTKRKACHHRSLTIRKAGGVLMCTPRLCPV